MQFTKMQGCGNDYVYINGFKEKMENKSEIVKIVSDRHYGIGSDGVIFINSSNIADFEMEMYNADGSRSEMCGNGMRCVGKYVFDYGLTDKTSITVESFGDIKYLELEIEEEKVKYVKVNMGEPKLLASQIPVISKNTRVINEMIKIDGENYNMTCVSMGNPHAVIFLDEVAKLQIEKLGTAFENNICFPNRTNTEFVKILNRTHIEMRVWERGSGETLACGTGACAVVVAAVLNGLTERKVLVKLLGGNLEIEWDQKTNLVYMRGPATTVFEGVWEGF